MEQNTFAIFFDIFGNTINGAFNNLLPFVEYIAYGMITLGLMWLCLSTAFGNSGPASGAARLCISGGFVVVMIRYVAPISEGIMNGAVRFGVLAGGASISADDILRGPDTIFVTGLAVSMRLWEVAQSACGPTFFGGCLPTIGNWLPVYAAAWLVFIAFAILALIVMIACVMFKVALVVGILLVPASVFAPTASFGGMPIRGAVHCAVQLFAATAIVSISTMAISSMTVHTDPGIATGMPFLLAGIIMIGLTLSVSAIAAFATQGTMNSTASAFMAPIAMGAAAARSGAARLDGPGSAAVKKIADQIKAGTKIGDTRLAGMLGRGSARQSELKVR